MDWLWYLLGFWFCAAVSFLNLQTAFAYAEMRAKFTAWFYAGCLTFVCGAYWCMYGFIHTLFGR
jgi:hypothetical protein